ncbi:hypothetical protein KY284_023188 [Solanum tuberosum]|nr:hypothetical protein KY284_023188 [Solanum tuberosum]
MRRTGGMWAKLQVLYGENLVVLMSIILFIGWMVSANIYSFNIVTKEGKSLPAPSGLETPCVLEASRVGEWSIHRFIPIIIWKDGEILMQSERGTQLVSYNPKEEMLKVVNVYGSATEATRYIPSFYSLNTVMGDNFQISNAYRRTQIV